MKAHPRDPGDPRRDDRDVVVADFRLTWADVSARWAGGPMPGMPVLRWPCGAVCEPATLWFGHSLSTGRVVASSAAGEAYALRLWLCWLWRRGVRWDMATDADMRAWRASRRAGTGAISARQAERDCAVVHRFYADLPEAEVLDRAGAPPRRFVGPPDAVPRPPITSRVVRVETRRGVVERTGWRWAGRVARRKVRRPTPSVVDVARLLTHLRGRASAAPSRRPNQSADLITRLACDRDWLIARCMAEAGLRADEAAGLSISALVSALAAEGAPSLKLASDPEVPDALARARILDRLGEMSASGRRIIDIEVTCKGSRRACPFPIGLLADLLSIGLWVVRERVLRAWRGRDPDVNRVFLSTKTGRGLEAGSVSDVMSDGFRAIGVASSGHRVRAHFAENLALALLEERLALSGGVLDDGVVRWVMRRVADALGHTSPGTTTAHYVDKAILKVGRRRVGH